MYYRRKIVLALIELLGGEAEKLRLQKLLFLYSQRKRKPEYEFVPYKFGCYSYSLNADINAMIRRENVVENGNFLKKVETTNFFKVIKIEDAKLLTSLVSDYGSMSNSALIKHTYLNFPYSAINSRIVEDVLSKHQLKKVEDQRPDQNEIVLFTIGYEGISLEAYLNKMIRENIKVLVDVRKNPQSMKYGFSKKLLSSLCEALNIEYLHLPEVGIDSDARKSLASQEDYNSLFDIYRSTTLLSTTDSQYFILKLLKEKRRIALTCFESEICQCHRKPLADSIVALEGFDYELKHL